MLMANLEGAHDVEETLSLLPADQVGGRDRVVLQVDLAGLDSLVAELLEIAADGESGTLLPNEQAHAAVRRIRVQVGFRGNPIQGRGTGVGDEHLAAVQDVPIALARRSGADPLQIAAGVRLGQAHGAAIVAASH